jgi:hypothetical protein
MTQLLIFTDLESGMSVTITRPISAINRINWHLTRILNRRRWKNLFLWLRSYFVSPDARCTWQMSKFTGDQQVEY